MTSKPSTIAIIGGTGDLGTGLARTWSRAGYNVILGSRVADKAIQMAAELGSSGFTQISGTSNVEAASQGEVVVIAVPFGNLEVTLSDIREVVKGKIVVTAVVPLVPPRVSVVQLPSSGSAALIAQAALDPTTKVVGAFHNVGSHKLHSGEKADCDVLVFADDAEARQVVVGIADAIANRGIEGGALANSAAAEAMTSVLIAINRKYKVKGAGVSISGLS